jgi:membrane protease YdiL (CAAX protease family)
VFGLSAFIQLTRNITRIAIARSLLYVAAIAFVGFIVADFVLALTAEINSRIAPSVPWSAALSSILIVVFWAGLTAEGGADRSAFNQWPIWTLLAVSVLGVLCFMAFQGVILSIWQGSYGVAAEENPRLAGSFITIPLFAAIVEEMLFRGIVQVRAQHVVGARWAVLFTTCLFVPIHIVIPGFEFQWPLLLALSFICGWVASRGSLLAAILIHAIYNVSTNTFLHINGEFYFDTPDNVRTMLLALGGLVAGAGLIATVVVSEKRCRRATLSISG